MSENDFSKLGLAEKFKKIAAKSDPRSDPADESRSCTYHDVASTSCYMAIQTVAGHRARVTYGFGPDLAMIVIQFDDLKMQTERQCLGDMTDVARRLAEKYGPFDAPPAREDLAGGNMSDLAYVAVKSFPDRRIHLHWNYVDGNGWSVCTRYIEYTLLRAIPATDKNRDVRL